MRFKTEADQLCGWRSLACGCALGAAALFVVSGCSGEACSTESGEHASHAHDGDHDHDHAHDHDHDHDHEHSHDGDGHEHAGGDHDGEGSDQDSAGHHDGGDGGGHDHDVEAGGHDHDGGGHGHGAGAVVHDIDPDAFGGRQMQVEVAGSLTPGSDVHVEGDLVSGPRPASLRLWVGVEDGVGSMKARAHLHGSHFHVHVLVPDEVPAGSALWFEAMGEDGERQSVSVPVE